MDSFNNKKTDHKITSIITANAISFILISASTPVKAENPGDVMCAGVVKAGVNDCASTEHVCAGMNTEDGYASDWLWLPEGTCKKIKGATIISNDNKSPKSAS